MNTLRALGEFLGGMAKRPRAYVAAVVPIAVPLVLASVNIDPAITSVPTQASLLGPSPKYSELTASPTAQLPQHSVILTMEDGDTLDTVFTAGGLSDRESALLTREVSKFVDVRRLRPGNLVRIHYQPSGTVDSVELKVNGWGEVDAIRATGETFQVTGREAVIREVESTISATIDSSLWEAIRNSGENPQLVQSLVDVFQWDVDFFALQRGDSFSVVVKKRYSGSDLVGYGPILAARFDADGDHYEAFRHEGSDGPAGYYSRTGSPLRKQFLRAPLQFTRITSGFSKHRFHPLLHYFRPHNGVDYGAPVGTPVMTTADGVVVSAGYSAGEGNVVKIRHTSRIETAYLHLSRFAKGIRRGARVTQGDVIGYVGMTGLATGPHLDYRVNDGGKWMDPLKLKSITPDPLRSAELSRFRGNVARLLPRLSVATDQVAQVTARRRALFQ